jgi:uncharacterized protein
MKKIKISINEITFIAELNDSTTAQAIWQALPIKGQANRWGQEIYFDIPVSIKEAPDATANVNVGAIAYWPPGNAFCLFWGPTPVSVNEKPRAASAVNVFGTVLGDLSPLDSVNDGDTVSLTVAE